MAADELFAGLLSVLQSQNWAVSTSRSHCFPKGCALPQLPPPSPTSAFDSIPSHKLVIDFSELKAYKVFIVTVPSHPGPYSPAS